MNTFIFLCSSSQEQVRNHFYLTSLMLDKSFTSLRLNVHNYYAVRPECSIGS